jgi:hypothetical protein
MYTCAESVLRASAERTDTQNRCRVYNFSRALSTPRSARAGRACLARRALAGPPAYSLTLSSRASQVTRHDDNAHAQRPARACRPPRVCLARCVCVCRVHGRRVLDFTTTRRRDRKRRAEPAKPGGPHPLRAGPRNRETNHESSPGSARESKLTCACSSLSLLSRRTLHSPRRESASTPSA